MRDGGGDGSVGSHPSVAGSLRVLTWNVRDHLGDPFAVDRVLRAASADVVCLQEASRRPGSGVRLAALARRAGLVHVTGGRASGGTALLVHLRTTVTGAAAHRLPVAGRLTRSRGVAGARVGLVGCTAVEVVSVHLGLDAAERRRHVDLLLRRRDPDRPLVVAGDLNEPPDGPAWRQLAQAVRDPGPGAGPTFPAARPRVRIDAVLVSPGLDVTAYGWPDGVLEADVVRASDHRPVLAEVVLPPSA